MPCLASLSIFGVWYQSFRGWRTGCPLSSARKGTEVSISPISSTRKTIDPDKSDQAKAFATLIEGMDKSLGDVMDQLEKLGIAENTLIFFLGDNGGDAPLGDERGYGSSAPLRGKKGTEFEGGMRVPFIVGWAKPEKKSAVQKHLPIDHFIHHLGIQYIFCLLHICQATTIG